MTFNEPPEFIWLQYHGDADPEDYQDCIGPDSNDVTWCWEQIFDYDITYVRADKIAELEKSVDMLKTGLFNIFHCNADADVLREIARLTIGRNAEVFLDAADEKAPEKET